MIPSTSTATTLGERVFSDIVVKGGEKSTGVFVSINAKWGRLLACFIGSVFLSLMASTTTMMD
jgi:hypothetical protein